MPPRVGRKPIKTNVIMKQTTVWLDPTVTAAVVALVGKNRVSEFIRDAVEAELKRREKLRPPRE